jgi:FixJ family two-component response regulator
MTHRRAIVSVIDDDASVRDSLPFLLNAFGFTVNVFSSAEDFLASGQLAHTECLILDMMMPGMCGPDLQKELKRRRQEIPIIFMTGQMDENLRSRVLEEGAVACLFKPFTDEALLDALNTALPPE